jgi:hypothetical protein
MQWLFIIEGVPSVLLGAAMLLLLPFHLDYPLQPALQDVT